MSKARNNLVATVNHITTLKMVIGFLILIIVAQWFRNEHLQDTRRIYVPPNLTQGIMTTFDEVPSPIIYTFAYYIFQQLNRWNADGEKDYPEKIYALQGFMTSSCINAFKRDMNKKMKLGELRQRVRLIQEISGRGFQRQRVHKQTDKSWLVWLDTNLVESIGGHEVKNINLRYQLTVEKFDVDKEVNPWGLALSCESDIQPILLSEDDLQKSFTINGALK